MCVIQNFPLILRSGIVWHFCVILFVLKKRYGKKRAISVSPNVSRSVIAKNYKRKDEYHGGEPNGIGAGAP